MKNSSSGVEPAPVISYASVLFLVFKRGLWVLGVGVPTMLVLILSSAMGSGGSPGGFAIFLTLGLCGLAWACLPLIHAGPRSAMFFAIGWAALALSHFITSADGVTGFVVTCWFLATLFLVIKLKAQPPDYFPPSWKESATNGSSAHNT